MHITVFDYILLPLYIVFFYWRAKKMSARLQTADLKKYLFIALTFRMLGAFAYSMLIEYYYGYGDSFSFFFGGKVFTEHISKYPSDFTLLFSSFKENAEWHNVLQSDDSSFFETAPNNLMSRISAILSYLSFGKYLIIAMFCGFFSFLGQWKLFLVFDEINQHRNRKLLAIAVLCMPSIWFWSSGLLKDTICLGAMGFIVHILYKFFIKKSFSISNLLLLLFLVYIVYIIKSYILAVFLMGIILMGLSSMITSIKSFIVRLGLIFLSFLAIMVVLYQINFANQLSNITEVAFVQIKGFQNSYEYASDQEENNSKAGFGLGLGDMSNPSINTLILKSPLAVITCLYRPFPWESRKVIIFFASLEAILSLLATLFVIMRLGFIRFVRTILNKPFLLFCFTISILFALLIGFTTFNFGTMIRYKVIFVPFFYFLLVSLYSEYKVSKKRIVTSVTPSLPAHP